MKPKIRLNTRDMDMVSRHMQGESYRAIAEVYGVSYQAVYAVVQRTRRRVKQAIPRRGPTVVTLGRVAYMGPGDSAPADLFSPIELTLNLNSPDLFAGDSESRDYTE